MNACLRYALLSAIYVMPLAVSAWEDFGPLAQAMSAHPEFFAAGNVSVCTLDGLPHYIFNGYDERLFSGRHAESTGTLMRRAELYAKQHLINYFKGTKILKGNFNDEDLKI